MPELFITLAAAETRALTDVLFFPFSEYWWFYAGFTAFVLLLLALDLGVFHREAHEVSFREVTTWSVIWVTLALVFNYLFYLYAINSLSSSERLLAIPGFNPDAAARQAGLEFLTGYIVEKSLAVDNIFVFVVARRGKPPVRMTVRFVPVKKVAMRRMIHAIVPVIRVHLKGLGVTKRIIYV